MVLTIQAVLAALLAGIVLCFTATVALAIKARSGGSRAAPAAIASAFTGLILLAARLYIMGYGGWWVMILMALFLMIAFKRRIT